MIIDFLTGLAQIGGLVLMLFVFYAVLQIIAVVREERKESHERRFER